MEENKNGPNNVNENVGQNSTNENMQNNNMNQNANNYAGQNAFNNANVKKQAKEATGFFKEFFKDPLGKIAEITKKPSNKYLKIAAIILVVWLVIIFMHNVFSTAEIYLFSKYGSFPSFLEHFFSKFLDIIKELIAPICSIAIISALAYGFSKEKNKSFMHIASSVTIAKIPVVIAEIVGLLTLVGSKITTVTIPFAGFCGILSIVLLFFTLKDIVGEKENKNIFWKFALIMGIYYAIEIVLSFLKIYI
jgi:membrane protein